MRSRQPGHSSYEGDELGEPEEADEVSCFLFIACGDTAAFFETSEDAFDDVASFVPSTVVAFLDFSGRVGTDARLGLESLDPPADRVAIVGGVGNDELDLTGREVRQQRFGLRRIAPLAWRQHAIHQAAAVGNDGVNLSR